MKLTLTADDSELLGACVILATNSDDFPDMLLQSGMNAEQNVTEICKFK